MSGSRDDKVLKSMTKLMTVWSELPSEPEVDVLQILRFDERKRSSNKGF